MADVTVGKIVKFKESESLANNQTHVHEYTIPENTSGKRVLLRASCPATAAVTFKANSVTVNVQFTDNATPNVKWKADKMYTVQAGKQLRIEVLNQSGAVADVETTIECEQS